MEQFSDVKIIGQMDDAAYWLKNKMQDMVDNLDYAIDSQRIVVFDHVENSLDIIIDDAETACADLRAVKSDITDFDNQLRKLIALRVKLGDEIDRPFALFDARNW